MAFQKNAFQNSAFQTRKAPPAGGGGQEAKLLRIRRDDEIVAELVARCFVQMISSSMLAKIK